MADQDVATTGSSTANGEVNQRIAAALVEQGLVFKTTRASESDSGGEAPSGTRYWYAKFHLTNPKDSAMVQISFANERIHSLTKVVTGKELSDPQLLELYKAIGQMPFVKIDYDTDKHVIDYLH